MSAKSFKRFSCTLSNGNPEPEMQGRGTAGRPLIFRRELGQGGRIALDRFPSLGAFPGLWVLGGQGGQGGQGRGGPNSQV